jgi:hypothetical protein
VVKTPDPSSARGSTDVSQSGAVMEVLTQLKSEWAPLCVHIPGRCSSQAEFCVSQAPACMNKVFRARDGKKVTC